MCVPVYAYRATKQNSMHICIIFCSGDALVCIVLSRYLHSVQAARTKGVSIQVIKSASCM